MATLQRSTTPAFRAVNSAEFLQTELPIRTMNAPRSQITPPPPPPPAYGFQTHTSRASPPTIKDEGASPQEEDIDEDIKDEDRDSVEPAEKSGASGKGGRVKKKKGTKFHCTGFGSCNLAFTRSEHLARHIRKHTGERPFMCHCGRWFSRLDNLRQHSSTVHADEEIPAGSLAATGTRYQRHGRTERVRPRSRAQSQSDIQPPADIQQPQPNTPALESPMVEDRRTRRRPDPIVVPQDADQDDTAFNQYRDHTPPDSPASAVSAPRFGGAFRQHGAAAYPAVSEVESPVATPTSTLGSPYGSPNYSRRNSLLFDNPSSSIASRRLSMPYPSTPTAFGPSVLPAPPSAYGSPAPSIHSRRGSLTAIIADDRRRTWHMGSSVNTNYQNLVARDIITPTTQSFARASIHSPTEPSYSPIAPARSQQTDRLPSIRHVLQEFAQTTPELQRPPWAGEILERPLTSDLKRPFNEGISAISGRRVAPGQVRSSHGRSISNIETRRWGPGHSNPFSGPWDARDRREASLQPHGPTHLPVENTRNSGYLGGVLSNIPSPREHRQSFGSSDSSASEGIVTPVVTMMDASGPRILGEPGDAVYHTDSLDKEYNDRSCEMAGVENTGSPLSVCNDRINADTVEDNRTGLPGFQASRLDALVSAAAVAAKI